MYYGQFKETKAHACIRDAFAIRDHTAVEAGPGVNLLNQN